MISTEKFEYADSRWQDIFKHLEAAGFDVYPPSVKVGECTSKYIVLKNDGSSKHELYSTDVDIYAVMCYVPRDRYSELEPMIQKVKATMKGLEPMIVSNGFQTPSFYDDSYKAHMVSIQYKNYKKML